MILTDAQIEKRMEEGSLVIEGFRGKNLTPNGYDLTIESISIGGEEVVEEGSAFLPQGTWFAVSTGEYVRFPKDIVGQLWIRTSWARKGVLASFGMIDAGFHGNLTLSAFNSNRDLEMPIGETFAQLVFIELDSDSEKSYEERSGNYQGQKGIKL